MFEENGFTHTKCVYHEFEAMIIQPKNEIIVYQVLFGEYRTETSTFSSNIADGWSFYG